MYRSIVLRGSGPHLLCVRRTPLASCAATLSAASTAVLRWCGGTGDGVRDRSRLALLETGILDGLQVQQGLLCLEDLVLEKLDLCVLLVLDAPRGHEILGVTENFVEPRQHSPGKDNFSVRPGSTALENLTFQFQHASSQIFLFAQNPGADIVS